MDQPPKTFAYPTTITTDHIQQYLDENKWLILAVYENLISGKKQEYDRNLSKLHQNLEFLARIADSQSQQPSNAAQNLPHAGTNLGSSNLHSQQLELINSQLLMAAQCPIPPMPKPPAGTTPSTVGMSSVGVSRSNMLQGEGISMSTNAMLTAGLSHDVGSNNGAGKEKAGSLLPYGMQSAHAGGQTAKVFPNILPNNGAGNRNVGSPPSEEVRGDGVRSQGNRRGKAPDRKRKGVE